MPARIAALAAGAAAVAYVAVSYAAFKVPVSLAEAEACGFLADDFNAAGALVHSAAGAWWTSFMRQQEYWSVLSLALAAGFAVYALSAGRRIGRGVAAGAALGGGVLALSALRVSCLAPALSVVGLGLAGTLLAGLPKWLIALNTAVLTGWGTLFLSRRLASCPLPACPGPSASSGAT
jgi:hypothetical protein